MAIYTIPTSCGFISSNTEWTPDFIDAINEMQNARGSSMSYQEKEAYWHLYQSGGGGGNIIANTKYWIVQVGSPAEALIPSEKVDVYVANGDTFTIPGTVGFLIKKMRIGNVPSSPTTTGYQHDPNTDVLTTTYPVENTFMYFETIAYNSENTGLSTLYFNVASTLSTPTEEEIAEWATKSYTDGLDVTVNFNMTQPGVPQIAWDADNAAFTEYFIHEYDYGLFGPQGTFNTPIQVGGFMVAQAVYATIIPTSATFKP